MVGAAVQDRVEVNGTVHHALCSQELLSAHGAVRAAAEKSPLAGTAVVVCSHALAAAGMTAPTGHRLLSWAKVARVVGGTPLARLWPLPAAAQPPAEGVRKRKLQAECLERGAAGTAGAGHASKALRTGSHTSSAALPRAGDGVSPGVHEQQLPAAGGAQRAGGAVPLRSPQGAEAAPGTPPLARGAGSGAGRRDDVSTETWLHACRLIVAAVAVDSSHDEPGDAGAAPAALLPAVQSGLAVNAGPWAAAADAAERAQHVRSPAAALMRVAAALSTVDVQLRLGVAAADGPDADAGAAVGAARMGHAMGAFHPTVTAARLAHAVAADRLVPEACEPAEAASDITAAVRQDRGEMGACVARVQPACMASAQVAIIFAPVATMDLARCALSCVHILTLTRRTAGVGLSVASDEFPLWAWNACHAALAGTLPGFAAVRPLVREPESLWHSTVALTLLAQLLKHCADASDAVALAGCDAATAAELAETAGAEAAPSGAADGGVHCRAVLAVACMAAVRVTLALAACNGELAPAEVPPSSMKHEQACFTCGRTFCGRQIQQRCPTIDVVRALSVHICTGVVLPHSSAPSSPRSGEVQCP